MAPLIGSLVIRAWPPLPAATQKVVVGQDTEHIEPDYAAMEFDLRLGAPGLHALGSAMRAPSRRTLLPPDLFSRFESSSFWQDPGKLPATVQKFVREGRISVGHAKVILGLTDEKNQTQAAERVIKEGLNVRQTEGLVAKLQSRG